MGLGTEHLKIGVPYNGVVRRKGEGESPEEEIIAPCCIALSPSEEEAEGRRKRKQRGGGRGGKQEVSSMLYAHQAVLISLVGVMCATCMYTHTWCHGE